MTTDGRTIAQDVVVRSWIDPDRDDVVFQFAWGPYGGRTRSLLKYSQMDLRHDSTLTISRIANDVRGFCAVYNLDPDLFFEALKQDLRSFFGAGAFRPSGTKQPTEIERALDELYDGKPPTDATDQFRNKTVDEEGNIE